MIFEVYSSYKESYDLRQILVLWAPMDDNQSFTIKYDGPALKNGSIGLADLANALIYTGNLIESANKRINGNKPAIGVSVKAIRPGSCVIELLCDAPTLLQGFVDIFSGSTITAIVNLLAILGFGNQLARYTKKNLITFTRWRKGRKIKAVTKQPGGSVRVEVEDGEVEIFPEEVVTLAQDESVRRNLAGAVGVIEKDGIDTLEILNQSGPIEKIEKHEARYFSGPISDDEIVLDITYNKYYSIISLAFEGDNKWQLSDGNAIIKISLEDKAFIGRIDANEPFAKGDKLYCQMRERQIKTALGIKTEYSLLKVLDHKVHKHQLSLDFTGIDLPKA